MCLFRMKWRKQAQSQAGTPARPWKSPRDSSVELSTSYTISTGSAKLGEYSRGSQTTSTGSALSLASLKGLLADGAQIFSYRDLVRATENFSPALKLGGSTFRGTIAGKTVAVVVEKRGNAEMDFVSEVKSICNLHHSSLVRLVGGCMSGDQLYLVYEYIAGADLRQCLRSAIVPGFTTLKSWTVRLRVALDIAKGLEYLHEHASPPLVHKCIKSTSIILDNELHAHIANVGVARLRGETAADHHLYSKTPPDTPNPSSRHQMRNLGRPRSIKITGTHGYMAPEYILTGVITPKLDVYAFGVVLCEILSGQDAVKLQQHPGQVEMKKTVLPDVVAAMFSDSEPRARVRAWIDPLLRDAFPLDCACRAALVAKKCVETIPDDRPSMRNVSLSLEQIYMASKQWEDSMSASNDLMTNTLTAR